MRNLRWQILIAVGGLILVIGLLVGQTVDTDNAAPQPVSGGVYVEAMIGEPIRLNPILDYANPTDRTIDRLIYSGLVRFNSRGEPIPDLAAEWAVSADATLYTFTLRENAIWHDGVPVSSDDVIFTFSKLQNPDYPGSQDLQRMWEQINIIRLDDLRVQFQLPEPFAPFFDYLALGLLPDHLLRGVSAGEMIDHPFNLQPIGTGPFQFDRFLIEDDQLTTVSLVAFEDYYTQPPFLERIEFRFYADTTEALNAYMAGEVQGIGQVDLAILEEVLDSPTLNLHTARLPRIGLIYINTKHPEKTFLGEKLFRQALTSAINRQWIINQGLSSQGLVANGPILPDTWAYLESLEPLPFDSIEAASILDSLGWELPAGVTPGSTDFRRSKDDQPLALRLTHVDDPTSTKIAALIEMNWEAVGIEVERNPVELERLLEDHLRPRQYEVLLTEIDLSFSPDPDPYPFWHDSQAETGQNYSGFTDRNISIWLEQARVNPDFGRRADLYRSFQFRFQDQQPAVLLYYLVHSFAIDSQILGVSVGPMFDASDRFRNVTDWYLLTRRNLSEPD